MGTGIEAARSIAPEHAAAMDNMKDQLLLVLVQRLGGKISIPVEEIDGTGRLIMLMKVEGRNFTFEIRKKQ
jgi:hypothetical protein